MAVNVVCKLLLFLCPLSFILFTYYLLFCVKKEAKKHSGSREGSLANSYVFSKTNCPVNSYFLNGICITCPTGEFRFTLTGWISCLSHLNCENISHDVRIRQRLSTPGPLNAVKDIYLADWYGYAVVYSRCLDLIYADDCLHGLRMLEGLQGSEYVVQLIGACHETLEMVTAYHHYGSAEKLEELFETPALARYNTLKIRFQLCLDYVKILHFLHNSPLGTRVMCDSNDVQKTLSQYLVTDDFHLVINDLDALPEVNHKEKKFIKCGHRQLHGNFVAPEQLWPFKGKTFNDEEMPSYDEKIDIWRIPNAVDKLLSRVNNSNYIRTLLLEIHDSCKIEDPKLRPTAAEVLQVYLKVDQIVRAGLREEM